VSGLGDLIAALTRGLGFAPAAGCGCEHRRDLLNKMFPRPRWLRRPSPADGPRGTKPGAMTSAGAGRPGAVRGVVAQVGRAREGGRRPGLEG
jgi:hypothetical protein